MKGPNRKWRTFLISQAGGAIGALSAYICFTETATAWMTGFGFGFSIMSQFQNIILSDEISRTNKYKNLQYSIDWARRKNTQLARELMHFDHSTHRLFIYAVMTDLEDHLLEIRNIVGKDNWRTYMDRKGALGDIKPILSQEVWDEEAGQRAIGSLRTLIRDLPDELNDLQQMNSE